MAESISKKEIAVNIESPQVMLESPNLRFLTSYRTGLMLIKDNMSGIPDNQLRMQLNQLKQTRSIFQKTLYAPSSTAQQNDSRDLPNHAGNEEILEEELENVEKSINRILHSPYQNENNFQDGRIGDIEDYEYQFMNVANNILKKSLGDLVHLINETGALKKDLSVSM